MAVSLEELEKAYHTKHAKIIESAEMCIDGYLCRNFNPRTREYVVILVEDLDGIDADALRVKYPDFEFSLISNGVRVTIKNIKPATRVVTRNSRD